MRKELSYLVIALFLLINVSAYVTVYNPYTAKNDYVNYISTSTQVPMMPADNTSIWTAIGNRVINGTIKNIFNQTLNTTSTVTFDNITTNGYFIGQPLMGMLGSGIIQSTSVNALSEVNVTCLGLTCSYNAFIVRLVSVTSSSATKYCSVPAGSKVVTNNAHNVLYIDSNCNVVATTITTWFSTLITSGSQWDFGNMVCYNNACEIVNGIGLEQRRMMKQRILNFYKNHLSVTSGYSKTTDVFPNFNISSGNYIYLMDVVETPNKVVGSANSVEVIYPNGTGNWVHVDQNTMNFSTCQDGTSEVVCSPTNRWRRVFFFMIGYNDTTDASGVHQLLASQNLNYNSEALCLDTVTNPITYTLPSYYTSAAVPLYAYCVRPTDSVWSATGWIDLRTVKAGSSTASSTGNFVPYAGATQGVDINGFTFTAGSVVATSFNGTLYGVWNGSSLYSELSLVQNTNTSIWTGINNRIINATNTVICTGTDKLYGVTIRNGVLNSTCQADSTGTGGGVAGGWQNDSMTTTTTFNISDNQTSGFIAMGTQWKIKWNTTHLCIGNSTFCG